MQSFNFINLIKSLKSYENIIVILKKIYLRLFGTKNDQNFIDYLKYLKENSVNYESFFSNIDSNLWDESKNI